MDNDTRQITLPEFAKTVIPHQLKWSFNKRIIRCSDLTRIIVLWFFDATVVQWPRTYFALLIILWLKSFVELLYWYCCTEAITGKPVFTAANAGQSGQTFQETGHYLVDNNGRLVILPSWVYSESNEDFYSNIQNSHQHLRDFRGEFRCNCAPHSQPEWSLWHTLQRCAIVNKETHFHVQLSTTFLG